MNEKYLTGKNNSFIKFVALLQTSSKARRENRLFVIEGLRICEDAMENGVRFDKLIISDSAFEKYRESVAELSKNCDELIRMTDQLFLKLSDTKNPQGICAVCKFGLSNSKQIDKKGRYIALQNLADPTNLGAISRTAEALGATGIIVSSDGCDPYSPKVLRASMGTILRIPLFIPENFDETVLSSGLKTYACVVDRDAKSIRSANLCDGSVVIIGNEANGITEQLKSRCYEKVTIPMPGRAESLNAAAAAAIAMWEMMK